ncbi:MAG: DUF222 domain-containing protein [Tetrasphaera sp.]|nr:DUF222 domain-containing protein [Tetrasphaera sp.]
MRPSWSRPSWASPRVATGRLHTAVGLVQRAPALVAEMAAGRLDGYRASMVHADLADAPAAVEAAVVARLVGHARKVGGWVEPVGPLRRRTRTIVARCAPDLPVAGARADRRDRGIDVRGLSETLDEWTWRVPVEDSRLVRAAVEEHAGVLRSKDQDLSVPQSRSDALTALVLDHTKVTVHLHAAVPADDTASDLVRLTGFGATDTTLVPTAWLRDALDTGRAVIDQPLLCDPGTGALIAGDITRGFRPSTATRPLHHHPRSHHRDRRRPPLPHPRRDPPIHRVPRQNLPLPRLLHLHHLLRPRPRHPLAPRPDHPEQPHRLVPPTPPTQANPPLERPAPARRHHRMDHPLRDDPDHQPRQPPQRHRCSPRPRRPAPRPAVDDPSPRARPARPPRPPDLSPMGTSPHRTAHRSLSPFDGHCARG